MSSIKAKGFIKYQVLLLMTVYLSIAVTHIYHLPRHNFSFKKKYTVSNSIFKRRTDIEKSSLNYFLQRTAKTVINERKVLLNKTVYPIAIAFPVISLNLLITPPNRGTQLFRYLPHRFLLLSLCSFKIWFYFQHRFLNQWKIDHHLLTQQLIIELFFNDN